MAAGRIETTLEHDKTTPGKFRFKDVSGKPKTADDLITDAVYLNKGPFGGVAPKRIKMILVPNGEDVNLFIQSLDN